jgi:hypothetical protein
MCSCARLTLSHQESGMLYTQGMTDEPKQRTPKGEEIPVPTREDVLRDLKKVAKAKPSTPRGPKK